MKILLFSIPTLALIAFFSLTPAAQAPARGPVSVGYISPQRIFSESTDGKAGVAKVQTLQQQRANELRVRQQTLDSTRQQLAQATESATRAQLQQQEILQRTEFDRATAQAQLDFQTVQRQVNNDLFVHVRGVLDEVAKEQGIQLVLNSDTSLVWTAPGTVTDLTSAVIERLNAKSTTTAAPSPKP